MSNLLAVYEPTLANPLVERFTFRKTTARDLLGAGALTLATNMLRVHHDALSHSHFLQEALGGPNAAEAVAGRLANFRDMERRCEEERKLRRRIFNPVATGQLIQVQYDSPKPQTKPSQSLAGYIQTSCLKRADSTLADIEELVHYDSVFSRFARQDLRFICLYVAYRTCFDSTATPVLRVASNNWPLVNDMTSLGFEVFDTCDRPDIYGLGSEYHELHMAANSVATVMSNLEHRRPWLAEGRFR